MASLIHEPTRPRKPWRVSWVERRRRRTQRFATKREAERFVGTLATGRRRGRGDRATLDDWYVRWIEDHGPEWQPRTVSERGDYGDRLILPALGGMRLAEISRPDVREWRAGLVRRGTTPAVANRAVAILSACLGAAVEDDLLEVNPCAGLRKLDTGDKRREPATLAEVEGIRLLVAQRLDGAEPRPNPQVLRDRAAVSLLAYAGLRPSELAALRREDVRAATLVVQSAQTGGRAKGTKTGQVRTVPLIAPLREDLDAVLASHDGPLVLDGLDVPNWRNRVWTPAARMVCAKRRTPYACRHTFASLLIAERRPVHEVARLLGHSTPRLTLDTYGHLFDEAQLRPAESMEDAAARARHEATSRHDHEPSSRRSAT